MLRIFRLRSRGRLGVFMVAPALALSVAAAFAGCGDLIIPTNNDGDGGGGDGGGTTDDSSVPPGSDGSVTPGDGGTTGDAVVPADAALDCVTDADHPVALGCTGLYSDWPSRTISPDVHPYDPGLHLWSDGADKTRYIYFPQGTKIDTSNLNEWTFPVGTKVWKEFSLVGQKVETRFFWKLAPELWFRTTYQWSEDQQTATELTAGALNVLGLGYEIPATDQCATCHAGRIDLLLGFEIVSLASPNATGLNLAALKTANMLTAPPINVPVVPGADPNTIGSLGFLHANCGNACHNRGPSAFAGSTGLFMRLNVDGTGALPIDPKQTDTWTTAVGVMSNFQPNGASTPFLRIRAGDPTTSTIPYRDGRRDGVTQMPPIDSHLVDFTDLQLVTNWVTAMTP